MDSFIRILLFLAGCLRNAGAPNLSFNHFLKVFHQSNRNLNHCHQCFPAKNVCLIPIEPYVVCILISKYKPVTHLFNRPFVWLCLIPSSNDFCAIRSQAFLFSPQRSFRRSAACLDISMKSPAFPFPHQCLSFQKYIRANQVYNFPSNSLPDCPQFIPYFLFQFIQLSRQS